MERAWIGLLPALVLGVTLLVFWPGLGGVFLFDDFGNLENLSTLSANPSWAEFLRFILQTNVSTLGRPLALASFAAQFPYWPGEPAAFLRVNLLLHLLNGALLWWALLRLTRLMLIPSPRADIAVSAAVGLWLLAPLQVTTVLYVVQRMTELSATFVFAGLVLYLAGRGRLQSHPVRGLILMSLGIASGLGLGVLAKEGAALFPLFVLVLECTVLHAVARPRFWRPWACIFLWLPIAGLALYLAFGMPNLAGQYFFRPFTLWERLATEPRVLFMYLSKLLAPSASAFSLFYDDFPVSRSAIEPWTTLPAMIGLLALTVSAGWFRRQAPVYAFAVLWFLSAHLLESTFLALDLVFEHRNYVASVGIWFGLSLGALGVYERSRPPMRIAVLGALGIYMTLISFVTWQLASAWGEPAQMLMRQVQQKPDSKRARLELASVLLRTSRPDLALAVYEDASSRWPLDPTFSLAIIPISCSFSRVAVPPSAEIRLQLGARESQTLAVVKMLDRAVSILESGECKKLGAAEVLSWLDAALANHHYRHLQQHLLLLYARIQLLTDERKALDTLQRAIELRPLMRLVLDGALHELDAGRFDRARSYLTMAASDPRITPTDRWSYHREIQDLRELIELYESLPPGHTP